MPLYRHPNQAILNRLERIDISQYLDTCLVEHKKTTWWLPNPVRTQNEAQLVKEFLDEPQNTKYKSARGLDGFYYWSQQKVDFVASNLGLGFLFYFVCNGCGKRVKYLYRYSECESPLCRLCCRLKYKSPARIWLKI